ncbi:MAG TPA: MBL fold metallo-hydrolase [Flavobacteriaceae bacterium]|nr:MBL fold metallo-hydrolase [Flavobacteriaceae bacterium]
MKTLNFICSFILSFFFISACGQDVNIEVQKLSDNIYMLIGQGGNIGVSAGDDGVFIIDDQYAPLTPKIISALKTISDKPIKYVANTHHHGDHTGGNENLAKLGATIIAHDNVRKHLEDKPKEALPTITFSDKLSVYMNGEQVLVFHLDNAHTDGDSMLYFTNSNVLHTGDIYFNGMYPYIDLNSGGTVNGYIEAIKQVLIVIDDETKIIPGHGALSNKKEYQDFLKMLETLKVQVEIEIKAGKTEEDVAANTNLTKTYDDLGYSWAFINSEKIRRTLYKSLKN